MSQQQQQQEQEHRTIRKEAYGTGWREHFVDIDRASTTKNVGSAVSQSFSYVTIPNFATVDERCALHESALKVRSQQSQQSRRTTTSSSSSTTAATTTTTTDDEDDDGNKQENGVHILGASISNYNCTRYSVEKLLNEQAKAASVALLDRLLRFLEKENDVSDDNDDNDNGTDEMSDLAYQVFGCNTNLRQLQVKWYSEPDDCGTLYPEPKVNLYEEGGYFLKHADGMELTLLVVLSDSFEGGGTAFYKDQGDDDNDNNHVDEDDNDETEDGKEEENNNIPASIAKPPAGTAIIWGSTLLHMALPVTKGKRAVYVGSFELLAAVEEAKKDYYF